MSVVQTAGIFVARFAMFVMLIVIATFATLVTWKNIGFAWSQADGIWMGIVLVIGTVFLEIAKDWLPVIYYNQRHDAPKMALFVLITFVSLLTLSYACSMYWENVDGTNRASNVLLFFSHAFAAGGPVTWVNASKWFEERTTDGQPREPVMLHPAPMQQDALPAPVPTNVRDAFAEWVPLMISRDPDGSVTLMRSLSAFNSWAAAQGYPMAEETEFERLMGQAADQNGGFASGGSFMGISLADTSSHHLPVL